jgi:SNF2 family DNA or RNA helicase
MKHGANFSVPGAGKTRVALGLFSVLRKLQDFKRALVIAPKSAHESWFVEVAESFSSGRRVESFSGGALPDCDILLVNYERIASARMQLAAFLTATDSLLILDEAHRMKRGLGGVYGATCLSLGPLAKARLVLSGTPAPNGLSDLKSVFEFVWPGRGSRLFGSGDSNWPTISKQAKPLFTRTTKSELELPPLQTKVLKVELPPLHREIYDALLGQLRREVGESERVDDLGRIVVYLLMAATSPALLAVGSSRYEPLQFRVPPYDLPPEGKLRSLMGDLPRYELAPKLLEASRIARENADAGRKTVIWSTFIRNITTLEGMMGDLNPQVVVGNTIDDDRKSRLEIFRTSPDAFVLLTNPSTLGEGVSLHHECHDAVYIDRDFAAGRFLQSLDRIHRLGLEPNTVTKATVLVARGTIDELVTARLASKLAWMSEALDDEALSVLADLEEERESGGVSDASDAALIRKYLGNGDDA